jgi:hypothetical protein
MASIDNSKASMRNQGSIADLIVKGAIALVTAAFFIGAYLQFQVTFWLALIAALSVYIALLMLHTLMRRSERVDVLASEVTRLESELASVKGRGPAEYVPPVRGGQGAARAAAPLSPVPPRFDTKGPSLRAEKAAPPPSPGIAPPSLETILTSTPPAPAPKPFAATPSPAAPRPELSPSLQPWPRTSGAPEPMHDYW